MATDIGQQLRQAREARSLTIEEVAQATHMRLRYLEAMEAGRFDSLPSAAQARGFLRAYAEFLRLAPDPLLTELSGKELEPQAPATAGPVERKTGPVPPRAAPKPAGSTEKSNAERIEPAHDRVQEIFLEIGLKLKQQRELLGLSIDDVERHTHLRRHYLRALEAGDLAGLPSPVQGRGMLNNYAAFLGLDPEPILLRFAEGLQARLAASQVVSPDPKPAPARRQFTIPGPFRRLLSTDILIGGTFTIFLISFMVWGAIRIFAMGGSSGGAASPTAPSIADVLLSPPSATPSPTAKPRSSPQVTPTAVPVMIEPTEVITGSNVTSNTLNTNPDQTKGPINVHVSIAVNQRAWLRVAVDGKVEFEGRVLAGAAYSFGGSKQVEVLTSNGAALQVLFNQQDVGLMGQFGQVVNRIYTPQGIVGPTPTTSPTPPPATKTTVTPTVPGRTPAPTGTRQASPPALP